MRYSDCDAGSAWPAELLVRCLSGHRAAGHRIVFTNGCFDVLHHGHVRCLRQAAAHGDVLVVAVNSDDGIRKLKGPGRPLNPAADRAAVLAAIGCVDYVTIFEEDTPAALVAAIRPDVYAKGGDYDVGSLPEGRLVAGYGGCVVTAGYLPGRSTTRLIEKMKGSPAR